MNEVCRILIIEDDRLQYKVTERLLANARIARFEVDWAQTYEEGLRLLTTGDYAACLLDFQLGQQDGLTLIRLAREQHCDTPVIFLTADSSEAVDEAAMQAGASDYLVKGEITPRMLERSIRYSLKLEAAMRELRLLATHDSLTGLLNRRAFDAQLVDEVNRARRLGHPLTLLLIDLDHFKAINDTHGHVAGDAVLVAAARIFLSEVRTIDRVARIDGEEFAVLLMETSAEEGMATAERLVGALRGRRLPLPGGFELAATASIGVATLAEAESASVQIMAAADQALYSAKRAGRDRAVLAS